MKSLPAIEGTHGEYQVGDLIKLKHATKDDWIVGRNGYIPVQAGDRVAYNQTQNYITVYRDGVAVVEAVEALPLQAES